MKKKPLQKLFQGSRNNSNSTWEKTKLGSPKIVKPISSSNKTNKVLETLTEKVKKTIVLIPTYNEQDNIRGIIATLRKLYPAIMIMVIDDSSPDGTASLVKKIARKDKKIFLLDKGSKQGIGKAYIRGFNRVLELSQKLTIDYVVQMDADFSHDPIYLKDLLNQIIDHDLVIGSRYAKGVNVVNWPMKRILLSYFANQYVNFITRLGIHDVTSGFKVFRRTVLEQINFNQIMSNGYVFQIEINYILKHLGFKLTEVSIIFKDRQRGASKINFQIIREAMIKVLFLPVKNINRYKRKIK